MEKLKVLITWNLNETLYSELQMEFNNIEFEKCREENAILEKIVDTDIVYAGVFSRKHFLKATKLKWIQLNGHGANAYLFPEIIDSNVLLTNSGQVHSIPISEHVFALMLSHSRKILELRVGQLQGKWVKQEMYPYFSELYGKVIGIVGVGNIGEEVAKRAKAFGMKVLGIRKNLQIPNQYVDQMYSIKDIEHVFGMADYIVVTLPGTKDTIGLIGKKELSCLKKDAFLVNVGRGNVIIEADLIAYLQANKNAGAGLDVFATEPLPSESPFYSMENVILTPHIAGATPAAAVRQITIFTENLERFLSNRPLKNLVDKKTGY
jgi:D-2-hydroxyacid dehydrogenase (NADP+)